MPATKPGLRLLGLGTSSSSSSSGLQPWSGGGCGNDGYASGPGAGLAASSNVIQQPWSGGGCGNDGYGKGGCGKDGPRKGGYSPYSPTGGGGGKDGYGTGGFSGSFNGGFNDGKGKCDSGKGKGSSTISTPLLNRCKGKWDAGKGKGKWQGKSQRDYMGEAFGMVMSMMSMMDSGDGGAYAGDCKWCAKGDCWHHGRSLVSGGKSTGRGNLKLEAGMVPATPEEVIEFIKLFPMLTPEAIDSFINLDPRFQKAIINNGMTNARDPSSVLVTLCREALSGVKPGDWICHGCGDIQYKNNEKCRLCSAAKTEDCIVSMHDPLAAIQPPTSQVLQFVNAYPLEPHAVDILSKLDPRLQAVAIHHPRPGGSWDSYDTQSQNALLIARCKRLKGMKHGDWICVTCADVIYLSNATCRVCGTVKPR